MEELTQETMPAFLELLRTLQGCSFTYCNRYGRIHKDVRIEAISEIEVLPSGEWKIYLTFDGGIGTQFDTCVKSAGGEPVRQSETAERIYYRMTSQVLEIRHEPFSSDPASEARFVFH